MTGTQDNVLHQHMKLCTNCVALNVFEAIANGCEGLTYEQKTPSTLGRWCWVTLLLKEQCCTLRT